MISTPIFMINLHLRNKTILANLPSLSAYNGFSIFSCLLIVSTFRPSRLQALRCYQTTSFNLFWCRKNKRKEIFHHWTTSTKQNVFFVESETSARAAQAKLICIWTWTRVTFSEDFCFSIFFKVLKWLRSTFWDKNGKLDEVDNKIWIRLRILKNFKPLNFVKNITKGFFL